MIMTKIEGSLSPQVRLRMIISEQLPLIERSSCDLASLPCIWTTAWESKPAGRWSYLYYDSHNGISRESHLGRYSCDETGPVGQTNQTDKPAVLPCAQWNLNKRSRLHTPSRLFPSQDFHIAFSCDSTFRLRDGNNDNDSGVYPSYRSKREGDSFAESPYGLDTRTAREREVLAFPSSLLLLK